MMFFNRKDKQKSSDKKAKGKVAHPSSHHISSSKDKGKKQDVSLFHHADQGQDQDKRRFDALVANLQERKFNNKVIDLLGYKGMTKDRFHYLILSGSVIDGSSTDVHNAKYADLLKIGGTGIEDLPEGVAQTLLGNYIFFWRSYFDDLTCICLPLPNNSKDQQNDWQGQIDKVNRDLQGLDLSPRVRRQLMARRNLMEENLATFENVDHYLINQGYALLVFAKNQRQLTNNINSAIRLGEGSLHLSRMSVADKEEILRHINNPGIML